MEARTADGYPIEIGMKVWSNDLKVVEVTGKAFEDHGVLWWKTEADNGFRGPDLDGSRMGVRHPFSRKVAV